MKKMIFYYDHLEEKLLVGSLMFSTALIFVQICMREFFNSSLTWSEELSRYIFIWQIWLGTSIALREDKHINVELTLDLIKSKRGKEVVKFLGMIIWFAFAMFLVTNGITLVMAMIARGTSSSGMRVPLSIVYASVPVGSFFVILRLIGKLFDSAKRIISPKEVEL